MSWKREGKPSRQRLNKARHPEQARLVLAQSKDLLLLARPRLNRGIVRGPSTTFRRAELRSGLLVFKKGLRPNCTAAETAVSTYCVCFAMPRRQSAMSEVQPVW